MSDYIDPFAWLAVLHNLPFEVAALCACLFVSMMILGLRAHRSYVCLVAAAVGYTLGAAVAKWMYIASFFVAVPLALLAAVGMWFLAKHVTRFVFAVMLALALGLGTRSIVRRMVDAEMAGDASWVLFKSFDVDRLWFEWGGMVIAFLLGLLVGFLASRFTIALFFAAVGAAGLLVTLGPAVQGRTGGIWEPGAYLHHPSPFILAFMILVMVSILLQVIVDPDSNAQANQQ